MPFLVGSSRGVAVGREGGLGHVFEKAPDGNTYFAVLGPSIHLVRALQYIEEARLSYLKYPAGMGKDQALALELLSREVQTAVGESGVATARFAEERAKALLNRRILRPTTPKPTHLVDSIEARAIVGRFLGGGGAVGIGDISMLDKYPYWKAIEFGSTHLVGKELRGFFFSPGGPTRAGGAPAGSQAIFKVTSRGPKMTVKNPIRGKAFLTQSTLEAVNFRAGVWDDIQKTSIARLRQIVAAEPLPRGRRSRVGEAIRRSPFRP